MTTETDFAGTIDSDDAFSPEEQAAWDAMRSGEAAPEPQAAAEPAPAPEPAAEAAAPGEVVDPDAPDADDAEKNRGRFVRHGAFHKEREARKTETVLRPHQAIPWMQDGGCADNIIQSSSLRATHAT